MFKNYINTAFRNIKKQGMYSFINIIGLAIGLACFITLFQFILYHLGYDNHHSQKDNIYRIVLGEAQDSFAGSPAPLGPVLKEGLPEVLDYVRVAKSSWGTKVLINYKDKYFYESKFYLSDPALFTVFDHKFIEGDAKAVLNDRSSIVITESTARKYFGDEDPIGEILTFDSRFDFQVTGIVEDLPENSHFKFDFIIPFSRLEDVYDGSQYLNNWGAFNFYTYVRLQNGADPAEVKAKLPSLSTILQEKGAPFAGRIKEFSESVYLQPVAKIHLEPNRYNLEPAFDIRYIYVFSAIAFFVLLIACINFMNLSTARSATRAREVGMRKVIGAKRRQLIGQFLGESVLLSALSLLFALFLSKMFEPVVNNLAGVHIHLPITNLTFMSQVIGISLLVGLLSGCYPAFFISGFQPINTLKGNWTRGSKGSLFRNILVIFQFSISIFLVISALIVNNQMDFIVNKDLGLNKDHIVNIPIYDNELRQKYEVIKTELIKYPDITHATAARFLPSRGTWHQSVWYEGQTDSSQLGMWVFTVDHDFFKTFQIDIVKGRDFSKDITADLGGAYIINEAAAKAMGMDDPVGKSFSSYSGSDKRGIIVGVVRDFNFRSLHYGIEPSVFQVSPRRFEHISIKIRADNIPATLGRIEKTWLKFAPNIPFEYFFMDEDFDKMYKTEMILKNVIQYFTVLSIFIACLGLFGLASFTAERRTKEIGIRKALGASMNSIIFLLIREFIKWVLLANIAAWPAAYLIMNNWLKNFTYKAEMTIWIFIGSTLIALLIAILTVSSQALKAGLTNPVRALRYE